MQKTDHTYQSKYYDYINAGSLASARAICPIIINWFNPSSLIDIGCGAGAWCSIWKSLEVAHVIGVDGDYVQTESLLIDETSFIRQDLSQPFTIEKKFNIATSFEVAEHIPEAKAEIFIDNITQCADIVIFSAATPGQGGEFHVNEQPLQYWKSKFEKRGYRCFDPLRKKIYQNKSIEPWYRYNTLVYIKNTIASQIPEEVLTTEIKQQSAIKNYAPLTWRTRNKILCFLPNSFKNILIKVKHTCFRTFK